MAGRRRFLKHTVIFASLLTPGNTMGRNFHPIGEKKQHKPLLLATWNHGMPANDKGWQVLTKGSGNILDAVEEGVKVTESDLSNLSVGLQGLPDREGIVTLDASIMKGDGSCGSVSFVRQVKHPISLARKVMEKTPHVMLSGEGARQFAIAEGIPLEQSFCLLRQRRLIKNGR